MALSHNIRYLRKKQGWGQDTLAEKLGYKSYTTIQKWESGVSEPPLKVVHELASIFNVDINDLTNCDLESGSALNAKAPALTQRDERDIAKDLESIMANLESADGLMFDGNPMSDEARESMRAAIELGLRTVKVLNKETYTPKKYKKG